jgi:steroid 5-alpha reductase family enzyme
MLLSFILVGIVLAVASSLVSSPNLHPRGIINSLFCVVWFTRLGSFLFARILRDGRDERFNELKKSPIRFLGAWTIQAVWVTLLNLPVLILNNRKTQAAVGMLDYIGWGLWVIGFLIEALADAQKNAFRAQEANKDKFITTGLWAYSRHPNYFGEHLLWTGICISGSSVFQGVEFLGWASLGITALLLWKVTGIPPLEAKGQKKWGEDPAYQHYVKHTSIFMLGSPAPPFSKKE